MIKIERHNWDDEGILSLWATFHATLMQPKGTVINRRKLIDCREMLYEYIETTFGAEDGDDDCREFVMLFDTLSFLTDALRGPFVQPRGIRAAMKCIEMLKQRPALV